jgi:hypothetical protein
VILAAVRELTARPYPVVEAEVRGLSREDGRWVEEASR